jgi:hypothetical protein
MEHERAQFPFVVISIGVGVEFASALVPDKE